MTEHVREATHTINYAIEDGFIRIWCSCGWFVLHDSKVKKPVTKVGCLNV